MTEHQPRDESLWQVLSCAVAEAPPKAKRTLVVNALSFVFVLVVLGVDTALEGGVQHPARVIAMTLGLIGLALLSVTYVLHHVSQSSDAAATCKRLSFFRLRSAALHDLFLVLPVLAVAGSVLLAVAVGMLIRQIVEAPLLLLVALFFALYLVLGIRAVAHTAHFLYRHAREQAEAAAQAREQAVEAQLAALQAQTNPHFLFNALNTVASLVRTDGKAAEATVENLAEVLRRTLDRSRRPLSTVRDEVEYVQAYLAVEQERWGDRLRVRWNVRDDVLDLALPPMTIQPLVENALKHGLGTRLEGGTLAIDALRANGKLQVAVADDGVGFPPRHTERTGLGNLRKRLETLYGAEAAVGIAGNGEGATVTVEVPTVDATVD